MATYSPLGQQGPCGLGTHEGHKLWFNTNYGKVGFCCQFIFVTMVWLALLYTLVTVVYVYAMGEFDLTNFAIIIVLIFLVMWAHAKTMCSDPGTVPSNAHPCNKELSSGAPISMCGRCDGYKPPRSHHCSIAKRCISRMDHFCPWMNNAVGAKNQKDFLLFLIYTNLTSTYIYITMALHLIDYDGIGASPFTGVGLNMVRVLIFVLIGAITFTTLMTCNQVYGLATGLGTIDRMNLKEDDSEDGVPVPFHHVFGVWWLAWFLPLDPVFDDPEAVFQYSLRDEPYTKM